MSVFAETSVPTPRCVSTGVSTPAPQYIIFTLLRDINISYFNFKHIWFVAPNAKKTLFFSHIILSA